MGTNNFHSESGQYYCWELEADTDYDCAVWDLESLLEDLFEGLKKLHSFRDRHADRSYGSKYIGTISNVKMFKSYNIEVHCHIVLRSGYYSGLNADYHFDFGLGFSDPWEDTLPDTRDIVDELKWSAHLNPGMAKIHGDKIVKHMTQMYEQLEEQAQNALSRACETEIKKVGQFSNGEAVYKEVTQNK